MFNTYTFIAFNDLNLSAYLLRIDKTLSSLSIFIQLKFSKRQHNSLAFVASPKRTTDEGSLPEIAQYSPYYLPFNVLLLPKDQTIIFSFRRQF